MTPSSRYLLFTLAASSVLALDAPSAKRAEDYTFDLFSGPNLQDASSAKFANEMFYTTGGGVS